MPSLSDVRAYNATYKPSYVPVGVFVGGTSGIARGAAESLARQTNGNAHIILIGRNAAAAREICDSFPKPASTESGWKHEFIECDVSLLKNVNATLAALRVRLPRVNFLVASSGHFTLAGRDETAEGIDRKLAITYYSRATFALGLLPSLIAARAAGQTASVLFVLAAGLGSPIELDNLGLKRDYTGFGAMGASATYTDLLVEELGEQHPTLSFTHMYPGLVDTPSGRTAAPQLGIDMATARNATDAGEYAFYALVSAAQGANMKQEHAEKPERPPVYGHGSSKESKAVFEHTEATAAAFA